jgi:hypothetical protein
MAWQRTPVAKALTAAIEGVVEAAGDNVAVFDRQPSTLNPPAIVVGRPLEVAFDSFAFAIDEATLPVGCCAGAGDGDDRVAELIAYVRAAVDDPTLGGVVQNIDDNFERNWRNLTLGGVELVAADVIFTVTM